MLYVELYLIKMKVSPAYSVLWEIFKKRIEMCKQRFELRQILLTNK